jgi:hypothetical protein
MTDGASDSKRYWADERDQSALIQRCLERVGWHLAQLKASKRWDSMRSTLSAYYGNGVDGERTAAYLRDKDDATVEFHTNQVRPIINSTLSLIVSQWPKPKPRAKNASASFLAQTRLAQSIDESYQERTSGKARIVDAVRGGLCASSWTLGHAWAPQDGKEWDVDAKGQPIYEGDVQSFVLPPWRCVWDFAAADADSRKWVLFRRPAPRWDTAANLEARGRSLAETDPPKSKQYFDAAEKVRVVNGSTMGANWRAALTTFSLSAMDSLDALLGEQRPDEDVVWVWELRHLPTPALKIGRLFRFIEPDIALWDSYAEKVEYPYEAEQLHVREYSPERVVTGAGGHSGAFDLGSMQEFVDLGTASMASTLNVNGQNRFWGGGSQGTNVRDLGINGAVIESEQKPEVLDFPAIKGEVVNAVDWAKSNMREGMSLNDVVMGNPDKGMPAQAMALQKATALQYHAVAQGDFVKLVKWDCNSRLRLLKRFARTKRVLELVGKSKAYELKEWTKDDIAGVEAFDIEEVNPSADTFEARQGTAQLFVERGEMSMESYITFIQTGNLEQGISTKTAQKELVEANVELLQSGVGLPPVDMQKSQEALAMDPNAAPVFAEVPEGEKVLRILKSDPHHLAIPAYQGVLTSPSSREDAKQMKNATEAMQLSLQYWRSLTPDEAMAYGIPPLPSQMAMAAPPGGPPPPGAPGESEPPGGMPSGAGTPEEPDIKQPEQPVDPSTGQQVPGPALPS